MKRKNYLKQFLSFIINLFIMDLCSSLLGNSYELPSFITEVRSVKYLEILGAHLYIINVYLL